MWKINILEHIKISVLGNINGKTCIQNTIIPCYTSQLPLAPNIILPLLLNLRKTSNFGKPNPNFEVSLIVKNTLI